MIRVAHDSPCSVMSSRRERNIYIYTRRRFHHSSFLAGAPVKAAGEWLVVDGQVMAITDKTGHYKVQICAKLYIVIAAFIFANI